jgi:hypothetical protein
LTVNPLDQNTLDLISYSEQGEIKSENEQINDDIDVKLNLNCSSEAVSLPQNRKAVLDVVQEAVYSQEGNLRQNCIEQLQLWESETDPKTPYIGIAIWWLKEMIRNIPEE